MVYSIWYDIVYGIEYIVYSIWYRVYGIECRVYGYDVVPRSSKGPQLR